MFSRFRSFIVLTLALALGTPQVTAEYTSTPNLTGTPYYTNPSPNGIGSSFCTDSHDHGVGLYREIQRVGRQLLRRLQDIEARARRISTIKLSLGICSSNEKEEIEALVAAVKALAKDIDHATLHFKDRLSACYPVTSGGFPFTKAEHDRIDQLITKGFSPRIPNSLGARIIDVSAKVNNDYTDMIYLFYKACQLEYQMEQIHAQQEAEKAAGNMGNPGSGPGSTPGPYLP